MAEMGSGRCPGDAAAPLDTLPPLRQVSAHAEQRMDRKGHGGMSRFRAHMVRHADVRCRERSTHAERAAFVCEECKR